MINIIYIEIETAWRTLQSEHKLVQQPILPAIRVGAVSDPCGVELFAGGVPQVVSEFH